MQSTQSMPGGESPSAPPAAQEARMSAKGRRRAGRRRVTRTRVGGSREMIWGGTVTSKAGVSPTLARLDQEVFKQSRLVPSPSPAPPRPPAKPGFRAGHGGPGPDGAAFVSPQSFLLRGSAASEARHGVGRGCLVCLYLLTHVWIAGDGLAALAARGATWAHPTCRSAWFRPTPPTERNPSQTDLAAPRRARASQGEPLERRTRRDTAGEGWTGGRLGHFHRR